MGGDSIQDPTVKQLNICKKTIPIALNTTMIAIPWFNLFLQMVYNPALTDFIAQDEFEINIIEGDRRDQKRIEDINHIKNVICGIDTDGAIGGRNILDGFDD